MTRVEWAQLILGIGFASCVIGIVMLLTMTNETITSSKVLWKRLLILGTIVFVVAFLCFISAICIAMYDAHLHPVK